MAEETVKNSAPTFGGAVRNPFSTTCHALAHTGAEKTTEERGKYDTEPNSDPKHQASV